MKNKVDRNSGNLGEDYNNTSVSCRAEEFEKPLSWKPKSLRRWVLAGIGLFAVGLGALGTAVPGLPTTIFVIIAAWCFSKSCPWLEEKLLRNKMFGPSMEIIDGKRPFTRKARTIAFSMMSVSGLTSIALLYYTEAVSSYVLWIIFFALIAGGISIVKFNPRSPEDH
nr:YbaN family protein [Saprospiraceae bacterium]